MSKESRTISLRIDQKLKLELLFIEKSLNVNLTDAVRDAIHARYAELKKQEWGKSPAEILKGSGFVGSFEAEPELSSHYKKEILKKIKKKHGF